MEFTNKLFEFNNVFSNEFYKVDVGKIFQVSELLQAQLKKMRQEFLEHL